MVLKTSLIRLEKWLTFSMLNRPFAVAGRAAKLWLFLLILLGLVLISACQRSIDETTAIVELPAAPESYPASTTSYPAPPTSENNPGPDTSYPLPATPTTDLPAAYPSPVTLTPVPVSPTIDPTGPPFEARFNYFLPSVIKPEEPTPTPTPEPTNTPKPKPTPTPTIDFEAVRAELQAQGLELGFAKIGFHTGIGGNRNGLGDWMRKLDEAGVPFFIKSVDDTGPLFEAQEIIRSSDVPHTLVYRRSGDEFDTPDYNLPPKEAALRHWQLHKDAFPPELDPSLVWLETINEPDKERSEWLGQFALETARLAMADGFRWAAFGWSSGEPEVSDWRSPSMLAYLRLAAANPDKLAVALHEYSFVQDDIAHQYPFKVGRFQLLFEVVDQLGIPRPTVLITEWGWEYQDVPSGDQAIRDIDWAAEMYAPYPEIKGAGLWYLGGGFGDIANQAQPLIELVTGYTLSTYFPIAIPPNSAPVNPEQFRP